MADHVRVVLCAPTTALTDTVMEDGSADAGAGTSKRQRTQSEETVLDALNAGRDPKRTQQKTEHVLSPATSESFDESIACGQGELRSFLVTSRQQYQHFFPKESEVKSDPHNNLLIHWDILKMLPSSWYVLVYQLAASPGKYRAISEDKILLDSYPAASRAAGDADTIAGFKGQKDLRLVLRPNALRFLWGQLFKPMQAAGAWPSARRVMESGFELDRSTRDELEPLIGAVAPPESAWRLPFVSALRRRYWPAAGAGERGTAEGSEAAAASASGGGQVAGGEATDSEQAGAAAYPPYVPTHGFDRYGVPRPLSSRMQCILRVGASLEPDDSYPRPSDATLRTFRTRLEATGRFSPDRIDRLVPRLADQRCPGGDGCGRFGCHEYITGNDAGQTGHFECACGAAHAEDGANGWNVAEGDLCPHCGDDPFASVQRCSQCSAAMPDWRDLRPGSVTSAGRPGTRVWNEASGHDERIEPLCAKCVQPLLSDRVH